MNLDDLVRRQESVSDALLERIGVNRLAEVMDVGDVLRFLRGGGKTDLSSRGEIIEDLPPGGVFRGAAAVTLIDDDEIEELARQLAKDFLALLGARDRLIERKVDLVRVSMRRAFYRSRWVFRLRVPSSRSMVLELVLSFAIAAPKGRKSLTIV